ncbi:MAG: hypothetical protein JEZ10_00065 [Verrucomicrobia bacterium]|nr:hypothetical protein [Verrucomicrobiota bacterium]
MAYQIKPQSNFVEVHASGRLSHWDVLGIIHQLHKNDPRKETPDLWILDPDLDFAFHSFPPVVHGILKLIGQRLKKGCRSAILTADEFQRSKIDLYCAEAAVLPYETLAFTSRDEALAWLLN